MQHRPIQALAIATAAALLFAAPVGAQQYPSKPIRMIVPAAAGSATDAPARLLAEALKDSLGQPVVIANRVGAGGLIGVTAAVQSAPDGYSLLFTSSSPATYQ